MKRAGAGRLHLAGYWEMTDSLQLAAALGIVGELL